MKFDKRGMVPEHVVNLILGAMAVVGLILLLISFLNFDYDEVDVTSKSYFDSLIREINVAGKGSVGYFGLWMPRTRMKADYYVVYFGEKSKLNEYSKDFIYMKSPGKNNICLCSYTEGVEHVICDDCKFLKKAALFDTSKAPVLQEGISEFGEKKNWDDSSFDFALDVTSLIDLDRVESWGNKPVLKENVYFDLLSSFDPSVQDFYIFTGGREILLKSVGGGKATGISEFGEVIELDDTSVYVADVSETISGSRKVNWGKAVLERGLEEGVDIYESTDLYLFDGSVIFKWEGGSNGLGGLVGILEFGDLKDFEFNSPEKYGRAGDYIKSSERKIHWGENEIQRGISKRVDEPIPKGFYFLMDGIVWRWEGEVKRSSEGLKKNWVLQRNDYVKIEDKGDNYVFSYYS